MSDGLDKLTDRLYGFLDRNRDVNPSVISYDSPDFYPLELNPTELNVVQIRFTGEQYKRLLSSAIAGATLLYPENPIEAYYPLLECIDMPTGGCDQLADCIDSSLSVQNALSRFFNNYTAGTLNTITSPITPEENAENLLPDGYTCDNDHLMGMARYVVQALHGTVLELLEELELTTNPAEGLIVLVDNVEVVSWLGTVAEMIAWLQDNVVEVYQAAYTQIIEDEISCHLWCEFSENCTVSIELIEAGYRRMFATEDYVPPITDDFAEIASWFYELVDVPDKIIIAAMHYFALQALRFRSNFARLAGVRTLAQMIAIGADETDASWVLCTSCDPEPESDIDYDYRTGQLGSVIYGTSWGTYQASTGYKYNNGAFAERLGITHANLPSLTINEFRVYQYRTVQSGYASNQAIDIRFYNASNTLIGRYQNTWSQLEDYQGIPFRRFAISPQLTGVTRIEIIQYSLNSSAVGTWTLYGWGYS